MRKGCVISSAITIALATVLLTGVSSCRRHSPEAGPASVVWADYAQRYDWQSGPYRDPDRIPNPRTSQPAENYDAALPSKDPLIAFIRHIAASYCQKSRVVHPPELKISGNWKIRAEHYHRGGTVGAADGSGRRLSTTLEKAVRGSMNGELSHDDLKHSRFKLQFKEPVEYSLIEYQGKAVELIGDTVPLYELDRSMVRAAIEGAKKYLIRMIDPETGGVRKYYYARDDTFENRLHCIYTASLMFSLMRIYDFDKDESLWPHIARCSRFLLSMQNLEKDSRAYGGFHYSFYPDTKTKEDRFSVGTTSKSIFTLIMLYERTGQKRFLKAAELAADWLLTMQKGDGTMQSTRRLKGGKWYVTSRFSLLYNGQALSALSRLYVVSRARKYRDAAGKIARFFVRKVERRGYYLGDNYRTPNPVSSSWVILSLFDFCKASGDKSYLDIAMVNSKSLLSHQLKDSRDILSCGRWRASETTSGNGWLAEVFGEMYLYRKANNMGDLAEYLDALTGVTRYILQNAYTEQNSFMVRDPGMAIGGAYWNADNRYVRTDAVCHAVNAFVMLYGELPDSTLLTIPRTSKPLDDVLRELQ